MDFGNGQSRGADQPIPPSGSRDQRAQDFGYSEERLSAFFLCRSDGRIAPAVMCWTQNAQKCTSECFQNAATAQ